MSLNFYFRRFTMDGCSLVYQLRGWEGPPNPRPALLPWPREQRQLVVASPPKDGAEPRVKGTRMDGPLGCYNGAAGTISAAPLFPRFG